MIITLLCIVWIVVSIVIGIALGRFLEECETQECQRTNAPSPTTPHTAQDAALDPWSTTTYNIQ